MTPDQLWEIMSREAMNHAPEGYATNRVGWQGLEDWQRAAVRSMTEHILALHRGVDWKVVSSCLTPH